MSQATAAPTGRGKTPPYRYEKDNTAMSAVPPDRYAEVGMLVQHYPDSRSSTPTCAIVTRVGQETIDVMLCHPEMANMMPFSGVHHLDYQTARIDSEGAWRPLALSVAILKFMIAAGALVWDGDKKYVAPPQPIEAEKPKDPIA